jgi:FkbM family methyltransferase
MENTAKYPDLIYDVGMHHGEDTEYYLKKGFRVIGFEADPDLATACRRKFSDEIKAGKVTVVEGAIVPPSNENTEHKTIKFYKNSDVDVWGTVVDDWARRNEHLGSSSQVIEVPVVNFSECLRTFGIPHYLKIDIEGMDAVCIEALADFERKPDYISRESDFSSFEKVSEDFRLLDNLGYTHFKTVQQGCISRQTEPNPPKEGRYAGHQFQFGSSGLFGEDLPGKWKSRKEMVNQYERVFILYKLFGPYGRMHKYYLGRALRTGLIKLLGRPIPGYFDLHAKQPHTGS